MPDVVPRDGPLEDDLRVRRHLEVHGLAADELDRLAAEEPREHQLVDVMREGRRCGVRRDRVEPQGNGNGDPAVLRREQVCAAVLVHLPVHERRAPVDDLHAVHADVADVRLRVLRDDRREGDERGGVARPAALDRQPPEVDVGPLEEDLLARRLRHRLGHRVRHGLQLQEPLDLLPEALRRLHVEDVAELRGDVVELLDAEREAHAALGAELVDEERVLRAPGALEQQRRPTRLHDAVRDLRDLEVWVDLDRDALELALALEERDPVAEIPGRRHGLVSLWRQGRVPPPHRRTAPRLPRTRQPEGREMDQARVGLRPRSLRMRSAAP